MKFLYSYDCLTISARINLYIKIYIKRSHIMIHYGLMSHPAGDKECMHITCVQFGLRLDSRVCTITPTPTPSGAAPAGPTIIPSIMAHSFFLKPKNLTTPDSRNLYLLIKTHKTYCRIGFALFSLRSTDTVLDASENISSVTKRTGTSVCVTGDFGLPLVSICFYARIFLCLCPYFFLIWNFEYKWAELTHATWCTCAQILCL